MRSKMNSILCFLFFCLTASPLYAQPNIQDGLWEIRSTMEMEGMPFKMPETSYQQCITKNDLIPQKQEPHQDCKIVENKSSGNTITWKIVCESQAGQTTSQGSITYQGDSFAGYTVTTGTNMPSKMTQTMTGKRIGACK